MSGLRQSASDLGVMSTGFYNKGRLWRGYAALGAVLLVAGSALMAVFVSGSGLIGSVDSGRLWSVVQFTLLQGILSALLSVSLAMPVAFAIDLLGPFKGRGLVLSLFALPLSMPAIIGVMALLSLFGRNGLLAHGLSSMGISWTPDIYGLGGILLAHVFFNLPLAVRLMINAAGEIPDAHWKLAESLRFSVVDRFRTLFWPVIQKSLPGIAGLVFMLCVTSFSIVLVLGGGPSATTVEVAIYQALTYDFDPGLAAALTLVQLTIVIALMLILHLLRSDAAQPLMKTVGRRQYGKLEGHWTYAAALLVGAAALFIATPMTAVFFSGVSADHSGILGSPAFAGALLTSLQISAVSAAFASVLALSLAYASYASTFARAGAGVFAIASNLSIAFPPLVLGVGWFILASRFSDPYLAAAPSVIAANVLIALPFCFRILEPAVIGAAKRYDRLAQSLGMRGLHKGRIIDLPALARPLSTAFLFAMVLSLGDLGVITLFGNNAVQTLPALLFAKMGAYRSTDANAIALYLLILTMALTLLLQWLQGKSEYD